MRGWWGLVDPKSDLPTFSFTPLSKKTIDKFNRHLCGGECLQKSLEALATGVDMKKAAVAGAKPETYSWPGHTFPPMFGFINGKPKPKKEAEPDDDEEEY